MRKHRHARLVATGVTSSRENLCKALSIDVVKFEEILARPDAGRFRKSQILKKNGKDVREVYCPSWDVRVLLRRFNKRFFADPNVIKWPYFLYGCVPNDDDTDAGGRDYISCAAVHANARSLLKADIANFFPSITKHWVTAVFSRTLFFSDDLARDMATINCVDDALVQGSPCASYIAGALFGLKEGLIVRRLESKGYRYTRYVDDITISSSRRGETFALATRLIDDLLSEHDLERNSEKTAIARSGSTPLLVHGIRVGGGRVGLPRVEFKAIRAAVNTLENYSKSGEFRASLHYRRMYMRCMGLVGKLARTKDVRSVGYISRLRRIRPLSTQEDIDLCTKWVMEVERNAPTRSNYFFQVRQANRTLARLAVLAWTFPQEASALKARVRRHTGSYDQIKI